jgi:hypothetical protein
MAILLGLLRNRIASLSGVYAVRRWIRRVIVVSMPTVSAMHKEMRIDHHARKQQDGPILC